MNPEHDEIESSVAAFVLGALDGDEAEIVRLHLEGCDSCRALARRLSRAVDALPLAVGEVAPPAGLRQQILDAAASSRAPASPTLPKRTKVLKLPRRRPGRPRLLAGFGGMAAAAALVAFALGAGLGLGIGRSLVPAPAPEPVAQYSMTGSGAMAGAAGHVYVLRQEGLTLIQFTGLAQPADGKIYELWLIPNQGQPVPAGVFTPDPEGGHVAVLARTLNGLKALAVTEEAGPSGVSAPTQQPQLVGGVG
ncbi:MAG TPA: anti-sigma factor [Candidatus Dormibacteraeota bacterium]|nr:anti-sigma factor [Candidatus Dormibacteraeota bacterium]